MRYAILGFTVVLMVLGGALIGVGVSLASTPMVVGGIIGILISGLSGMVSRA